MTIDGKYRVPTVALHTDKFDRVVQSVTKMAGLPEAPRAFVPQPVMGKTTEELRAYVYGNDPITGRPVSFPAFVGGVKGRAPWPAAWSGAPGPSGPGAT